jgi:hypothetical protein
LAASITGALVVAGVLGLWFSTTRGIAIIAIAVLAFFYKWLAVLILAGSAAAFYLFRLRK